MTHADSLMVECPPLLTACDRRHDFLWRCYAVLVARRSFVVCAALICGLSALAIVNVSVAIGQEKKEENPNQYQFESIAIPPATADEAKLEHISVKKAIDYLDQGALAWNGSRKCV